MSPALAYTALWAIACVCDGWPAWIVFPFGRDTTLDACWQDAHLAQEHPL